MCQGEDSTNCSLHAAAKAPKYLDCPIISTNDGLLFSGEDSGLKIVNVSWCIEYCNFVSVYQPCFLFHIDYHEIYNYSSAFLQNFEVTSSGQLYISSVSIDMRQTTFNCSVWNESSSQWSQPYKIGPLTILNYGKPKQTSGDSILKIYNIILGLLYAENDCIPKNTFQEPFFFQKSSIGANKILCMQGEMLEAQVEWTRLEPNYRSLYQIDSSSHFDALTSRCFECGCIVDLIASKRGRRMLNSINESAKYISLTATGYYLPETYDAFISSLKCIGIQNWFLSVLWIRNVSESDVGSYGVTVRSTRSKFLNHTRNFTLTTGKHLR